MRIVDFGRFTAVKLSLCVQLSVVFAVPAEAFPDLPAELRAFVESETIESSSVAGSDAVVLIDQLEGEIIGNRLAIGKWHATIIADRLTGADGDKDQIVRADSFVDGDRMRRDFHCRVPLNECVDGSRLYVTIVSSNGKREYEYSETPDGLGLGFALIFRDVSQMRDPPTMERIVQYDPRAVGNFANGALSPAWGPAGTLKNGVEYSSLAVTREQLDDGTMCLKVSKEVPNAGVETYWASVREGLSIRRYQVDAYDDSTDPTHLEQTDTEVKKWKDTEIWLPVATTYKQTYDGILQVDEAARIEWHSINEPLEPNLFEPISFPGLDPGGNVYDVHEMLGPKRRMIWNGSEIVDEDIRLGSNNEVGQDTAGSGFTSGKTMLFLNAAVFMVIAGFFLWRSMHSSAK